MSSTVYRLDARGIPVKRPVLPPQRAGGMMDVPQQRGSHHGMCAGREEGEAGGEKEGWEGHSGGQPGRTVGGGERAPSLQQLQQGGRGDASEAMTSGDRGRGCPLTLFARTSYSHEVLVRSAHTEEAHRACHERIPTSTRHPSPPTDCRHRLAEDIHHSPNQPSTDTQCYACDTLP